MENAAQNWYVRLTADFNKLLADLGIDDEAGAALRAFLIDTSRSQYKAGNNSGIRWARTNPQEKVALQKTGA